MAITPASQAGDVGSIPIARSNTLSGPPQKGLENGVGESTHTSHPQFAQKSALGALPVLIKFPRLVRDNKSEIYHILLTLPKALARVIGQTSLYTSLQTRQINRHVPRCCC